MHLVSMGSQVGAKKRMIVKDRKKDFPERVGGMLGEQYFYESKFYRVFRNFGLIFFESSFFCFHYLP